MHTLLIAEDHAPMLVALRRILETDSRFTVVGEAASIREMLALAAELRPAVLLFHVRMPDRGQFPAALVKERLAASCGLVIAMSIWLDSEAAELAEDYGANTLIDKTNVPADLPGFIEALLLRQGPSRSAAGA